MFLADAVSPVLKTASAALNERSGHEAVINRPLLFFSAEAKAPPKFRDNGNVLRSVGECECIGYSGFGELDPASLFEADDKFTDADGAIESATGLSPKVIPMPNRD